MSFFFPRTVYHTEASLAPLLRLLDEIDHQPTRRTTSCHAYRPTIRTWQPRFDVRETANTWVLRGELPGLNKDHVSIELADPQKLVVRGTFDPSAPTQPAPTQNDDAASEASTDSTHTEGSHSYQATVEDDTEADDFEVVDDATEKPKPQETQQQAPVEEKKKEKEPAKETKSGQTYQFTRTFKFPTYVDQEDVIANLKDGLLTVVVQKPRKSEPRRIPIA